MIGQAIRAAGCQEFGLWSPDPFLLCGWSKGEGLKNWPHILPNWPHPLQFVLYMNFPNVFTIYLSKHVIIHPLPNWPHP